LKFLSSKFLIKSKYKFFVVGYIRLRNFHLISKRMGVFSSIQQRAQIDDMFLLASVVWFGTIIVFAFLCVLRFFFLIKNLFIFFVLLSWLCPCCTLIWFLIYRLFWLMISMCGLYCEFCKKTTLIWVHLHEHWESTGQCFCFLPRKPFLGLYFESTNIHMRACGNYDNWHFKRKCKSNYPFDLLAIP
jgi:hypothetical protein